MVTSRISDKTNPKISGIKSISEKLRRNNKNSFIIFP